MSGLHHTTAISFNPPPSSPTAQIISFSDAYASGDVLPSTKCRKREESPSIDGGKSEEWTLCLAPDLKHDGTKLVVSDKLMTKPKPNCIAHQVNYLDLANVKETGDPSFLTFVQSVLAEECSFWQLSRTLFVVNGWDIKSGSASSTWYHVHQVITGIGKSIACFCPMGKQSKNDCFHVHFLQQHGDEKFPIDMRMPGKFIATDLPT